jgi:hypothetical protein
MYDDMVMATAIWVYALEERGTEATPDVIVERTAPGYSVGHIFEEAEKIRRQQDREGRREMRRLARSERI